MKISLYIDKCRQDRGMKVTEMAKIMRITPNTYRARLKTIGFAEIQILAAARALEFNFLIIPKGGDILILQS